MRETKENEYIPHEFIFINFKKMQAYPRWRKAYQWFSGDLEEGRREGDIPKKFWGKMALFTLLVLIIVSWVYIQVKTYQNILFKYLQFSVCQLDLNKIAEKLNSKETKYLIKNGQRLEQTGHCRSQINGV